MKARLFILTACGLLVACTGSGDPVATNGQLSAAGNTDSTITEISGTTTSVLADYNKSSFSDFVYLHKTADKILVDYNFFPAGTDFDQQSGTAVIGCETSEDATVASVSAPTASADCTAITVALTGASFTNDGLVFSLGSGLTIFVTNYDFRITSAGFVDVATGETVSVTASEANLEAVHDAILN